MYMLLGCRSVYMGWAVTRASPGQFQLLEVPRYLIVNRGIIRSRSWVKFFAILIECIADVELKVKRLINFGHFPSYIEHATHTHVGIDLLMSTRSSRFNQ